jgi:hypothetical protein
MHTGPCPLPGPFMADGGSTSPAPSLDGSIVYHQDPFLPEQRLVSWRRLQWWNGHQGMSGRSGLRPQYGCEGRGGGVEGPVLCLWGKGRSVLPSTSEAMWNSSMESSIKACSGHGVPPRVEPMMAIPELSPMGERLCNTLCL